MALIAQSWDGALVGSGALQVDTTRRRLLSLSCGVAGNGIIDGFDTRTEMTTLDFLLHDHQDTIAYVQFVPSIVINAALPR